jgi:hypothetical protein
MKQTRSTSHNVPFGPEAIRAFDQIREAAELRRDKRKNVKHRLVQPPVRPQVGEERRLDNESR